MKLGSVTIIIPCYKAATTLRRAVGSALHGAPADTQLLLVDDHPVVRSGLRALLDGADGVQVVGAAASGEEALTMAGEVRPEVVVCDLRLGPGLDGVGVTTALRGQPDAALGDPRPQGGP